MYTKEFKERVLREYEIDKISSEELSKKYKIKHESGIDNLLLSSSKNELIKTYDFLYKNQDFFFQESMKNLLNTLKVYTLK